MNIYILNTIAVGTDIIELISKEIKIEGVIGLSDREKNDKISDFFYQQDFCNKLNIPFIELSSYDMSADADKKKLLKLEIDVIIVAGWQRLVPEWLIKHCKRFVVGSHGSPLGITKGRGRSPQNWALIMGMQEFHISIFQIDKNIDSGKIFASKKFNYSEHDDIKTSYYKISLLTSVMITELLKSTESITELEEQNEAEAEYFPQRKPEDGTIDWNRSNGEIRNLIRALTHPYPGATSNISGNKIKIWSAIPFDIDFPKENYAVGEVVKVFNKKDVMIRTRESFMLLNNYECDLPLKRGDILNSVNFYEKMQKVIDRHQEKYPELPISGLIKSLSNKN